MIRYGRRGRYVLRSYLDDSRRYMRLSSTLDLNRDEALLGRIAAKYHSIEKGLSLPEPRLGFGEKALSQLIVALRAYGPARGGPTLDPACDTLGADVAFHHGRAYEADPLRAEIAALLAEINYAEGGATGGLRSVSRDEVIAASTAVRADFFMSRHSVRQFPGEPVPMAAIEAAVRIAQKAPVVCNRQSACIRLVLDPDKKREALRLQAGTKGFGQGLGKLLVVTTDLSNLWDGERAQAYVDGGLFAISLLLGMHAQRLATIALNWSKAASTSAKLRRLLGLAESEIVVVMIGVGQLRETFTVPLSYRKPLDAVLRVHGTGPSQITGVPS